MGRGAGQRARSWRSGIAAALLVLCPFRPALSQDGAGPAIAVPSGTEVHWIDTITDTQGPDGLTLRFRFLAPGIGGRQPLDPEMASMDMDALCKDFALPRISDMGPQPAQVVISLSDRVVPFGETDEEAVQFFQAYSIVDGACDWEMF